MNESKIAVEQPSVSGPAAQPEPLGASCSLGAKSEAPGTLRKVIGLVVALAAVAGASWSFYSGNGPLNSIAILVLGGLLALRIGGVLSGG